MNDMPLPTASGDSLEFELAAAQRALAAGDQPRALRIWESLRQRYPTHPAAYRLAADALTKSGRLDEADAVLGAGRSCVQTDRVPLAVEHAHTAMHRGDKPEAIRRWATIRTEFPDHPVGYVGGVEVLREARHLDEADILFATLAERFPKERAIPPLRASLADARGNWSDAITFWQQVRDRSPDDAFGYAKGAKSLQHAGRLDAAEALLSNAAKRFADNTEIAVQRAEVAMLRRQWPEAAERWALVREMLPGHLLGYSQGATALREIGRLDEAEALLAEAARRFPDRPEMAGQRAQTADAQFRLARAMIAEDRLDDAEALLRNATARFPDHAPLLMEYARLATRRHDWDVALRRWQDAHQRFPNLEEVRHRLFEAQMRVVESAPPEPQAAEAAATLDQTNTPQDRSPMRDVIMQFESLGGTLQGCEFGLVQRTFGAEPLGLLRWTEMAPQNVIDALEAELDGVGLPENTELGRHETPDGPEWFTTDKRFLMSMHTFMRASEIPYEKMYPQCCRRLQFLRDKLLEDLRSGSKIFVYKITWRLMQPEELERMHAALRRYGDTTLLYVQRALPDKPAGTVELIKPGLMMGYIERFNISETGEHLGPSHELWEPICRRALALWRNSQAPTAVPAADGDQHNTAEGDRHHAREAPAPAHALDTTGILNGTDKSSLRWDYLRHYEELLGSWRDVAFNLLEIGIGGGHSLFTWNEFFTRATIIGIDIEEHARRCAGGRIVVAIGSQADGAFLADLCDRYPPSIIIDDGSHQAQHIMFSFHALFPRLAPGGWYVIEDLSITGGMDQVALTPHDCFAQTALALMHRKPGSHPAPDILDQIDRIDLAPGVVFIRKKDLASRRQRLEDAAQLAARTSHPNNYLWVSEALLRDVDDLERAELAARKAVALHPKAAIYHVGLADVLERAGDLAGALDAARAAVAAEPGNYHCHLRLAELFARSGDLRAASSSLQTSVNTAPTAIKSFVADEGGRILRQTS